MAEITNKTPEVIEGEETLGNKTNVFALIAVAAIFIGALYVVGTTVLSISELFYNDVRPSIINNIER